MCRQAKMIWVGRRSCFEGLRQPSLVVFGVTMSDGRSGLMSPPPGSVSRNTGFQHLLLLPCLPPPPPLSLITIICITRVCTHVKEGKKKKEKESSWKQEWCHLMSVHVLLHLSPGSAGFLPPSRHSPLCYADSVIKTHVEACSLAHSLSSEREWRHTHKHTRTRTHTHFLPEPRCSSKTASCPLIPCQVSRRVDWFLFSFFSFSVPLTLFFSVVFPGLSLSVWILSLSPSIIVIRKCWCGKMHLFHMLVLLGVGVGGGVKVKQLLLPTHLCWSIWTREDCFLLT